MSQEDRLRHTLKTLAGGTPPMGPAGRRYAAGSVGGLVRAIVTEIDDIILGRALVLTNPRGEALRLEVVNRRLLRIEAPLPERLEALGRALPADGFSYAGAAELGALQALLAAFLEGAGTVEARTERLSRDVSPDETGASAVSMAEAWALGAEEAPVPAEAPTGAEPEPEPRREAEPEPDDAPLSDNGAFAEIEEECPEDDAPVAPVVPAASEAPEAPEAAGDILTRFLALCSALPASWQMFEPDGTLNTGGPEDGLAALAEVPPEAFEALDIRLGEEDGPACMLLGPGAGANGLRALAFARIGERRCVLTFPAEGIDAAASAWSQALRGANGAQPGR